MKTIIYYFSGTGNTLALARQLSGKIGNTETIAVNAVKQERIKPDADCIGFMFPVYALNMPRIFDNFIRYKLQVPENAYLFAISNYASLEFGAMAQLKKLLKSKGHTLNLAGGVKMPSNYIPFGGAESEKTQTGKFLSADAALAAMAELIKNRSSHPCHFFGESVYRLISVLAWRSFKKRLVKDAARFYTDDNCNSCGLCMKVCPVKNIHLAMNKPVWGDNCEQCLACLQWCPNQAIQMLGVNPARSRYHHPDVNINDLINAKADN
ncbi:EFR1 family ferrodoxin [Lentisphaerota bacterium ZTH]|nr:EFR1 family ferrodoxin [Lentisphaerota bacterium]WET07705.1 EFR1 family ferrodoxin [Lentisphaerota bacterium ZTH]